MSINISSSNQPNIFTIQETTNNNEFNLGYVVKGNGDIDGDGKKDLIIIAPNASGGNGELDIVFGSNNLLMSSVQTIQLNSSYSPFISVSLGDINGDGKDDIIIGDPIGVNSQGKSYVIYGNTVRSNIATNVSNILPGQGFSIINSDAGLNNEDLLGWSVSSGDIDGDSIDDVIVGDPSANNNNGNVHVIFGKIGGYGGNFDISNPNPPNSIFTFSDSNPNPKSLGFSVATTNVNGDNKDDLIIGAPDTNNFSGEVDVVFGNSNRLNIASSTSNLNGSNGFTFTTNSQGLLGFKVSNAGDINGDNYQDLIVSATNENPNQKGRIYVLFGKTSVFPSTLDTNSIIGGNGANGFYIDGLNDNDLLGSAISAAGDVNKDGIDDLLIAAPYADTNGISDSGQVYVINGRTNFGSNLNLSTLGPNEGWFVNINDLATNDLTGISVSNAGDINGDTVDDFLIGAPGAAGGDGKVYVVLGQETNKPIPNTTVELYPYGYKPLIGEKHTFIVSFDNIASSPGNVGYAPFINLYLDTTGTDGIANNDGSPLTPYDGLNLVNNGIRYISSGSIGIPGITDLAFGQHSVPLNLLGITPIPAIIYNDNGLWVNHPYAGKIAAPSGFGAGDTLYVIPLPQGSFTPDQPVARFEIDVQISNLADYNQPLKIATSGGFHYGANSILDNSPIDPILDSTLTDNSLQPLLYRIQKNYLGSENEIVTGPNFGKGYNIGVNIAPGQTIQTLKIQDTLPNNLQYINGSATANPASVTINSIPPGPGGTISASFSNPITGNANFSFNFFIPRLNSGSNDVISHITGDAVTSTDVAQLDPTLVWNPLDPRDQPFSINNLVETPATHTLTDRSIALQKTWSLVSGGDHKAPGLSPGDVIEYTLNFQISDYFAFNNIRFNDVFSDGQIFDSSFTPTFTVNEHNQTTSGLLTGSSPNVFNLSQALVLAGQDDKLLGGFVSDAGSYLTSPGNFGATTGQIKFRTIIQEDFATYYPSGDKSVDNGDLFSNNATITADVLNINPSFTPTGYNESDSGSTAFILPRGNFNDYQVKVSQIKRNGILLPPGTTTVIAGDEVSYEIKYTIPFADTEKLEFESILPLPVFKVGDLDTAQIYQTPGLNKISYGADNTLSLNPTISINPQNNSLKINYGTFDDPNTVPKTIDLIYTLKVGNDVTEDNLILSNLVYEREGSTNAGSRQFLRFANLNLGQPDIKITNGLVATSEGNKAIFSKFFPIVGNNPPTITFTNPGTTTPRFSGIINSSILHPQTGSNHFDSDVTANLNNPQPDLVTYAIILENTGTSANGAFDVLVKDTLPTGLKIPISSAGLNLQAAYGNGTVIPLSNIEFLGSGPDGINGTVDDLFGNGIRLKDPSLQQGAIAAYNDPNSKNVVVITFDLEVDNNLANQTIITNQAILEEYSSSEGGTKLLAGSQSLTDVAKIKTQPNLQDQFNTFRTAVNGNLAGKTFTPFSYLGGESLTANIVQNPSSSVLSPFSSIISTNLNDLQFKFKNTFPSTLNGLKTITIQISDGDTSNNPSFDAQDSFKFSIFNGTVSNNYISGATVFFDANLNGELDTNEIFTTTNQQGQFTFVDDLSVYDRNDNGILEISEGQIVAVGGINTATGLPQSTALIATSNAGVVTPLTTIIAELVAQGLTENQANDLLTVVLSIPNSLDINNFDPISAINHNDINAVTAYKAYTQMAIVINQITTIATQFSHTSPSQILKNVVTAIANRIEAAVPLDLTSETELVNLINNTVAIGTENTALVSGFAQIIAAANQAVQNFANNTPITSLERKFTQVEKVAFGETKQDIIDVFNGNKTIAQAINENIGNALNKQISSAIVFNIGDGLGGQKTFTMSAGDNVSYENFGSIGKGPAPSVETINEVDTIKFTGANLTARNLLLTQNGDDLEITFENDATTKAVLKNFALENIENLLISTGGTVNLGNIIFDGETQFQDSFDVFNADSISNGLWNPNTVSFFNDLNNNVYGSYSSDVINGQGGDDIINGFGGNDLLRGGDGNDTLIGEKGDDILVGNAGQDYFQFSTNNSFNTEDLGRDTILDFVGGTDKILLSKNTFNQLNSAIGSALTASDDFAIIDDITNASVGISPAKVVYNLSTGDLFYNENGTVSGLGNGAQFATLTGHPYLSATDFLVI